jgi:hypothetical protein
MPEILKHLPLSLKTKLDMKVAPTCPPHHKRLFDQTARDLNLNQNIVAIPDSIEHCAKNETISLNDILSLSATDEPDQGIDKDLDASQDPNNNQKWFGSSQLYRHSYWGGFNIFEPLATFQIPPHEMGQAQVRASIVAKKAKEHLQGQNLAWGARVLGWALHYIQDLAQPFHTVQFPSLSMVPWTTIFHWPPTQAFENFRLSVHHSITNYHWAYETYVLTRLQEKSPNQFSRCFASSENLAMSTPAEIARSVTKKSLANARKLGSAVVDVFGSFLKELSVNLPENKNVPDYKAIVKNANLAQARSELDRITCENIGVLSHASQSLIYWALSP